MKAACILAMCVPLVACGSEVGMDTPLTPAGAIPGFPTRDTFPRLLPSAG